MTAGSPQAGLGSVGTFNSQANTHSPGAAIISQCVEHGGDCQQFFLLLASFSIRLVKTARWDRLERRAMGLSFTFLKCFFSYRSGFCAC